ncbi:MAG: DMT family transporter [Alphaproteobacteria bacterium]|nr:DMT family transporter [Alphaproteobacteria bacterium]
MTQSRAMLCALSAFFAWVLVDTAIKLGSQGQPALSPFVIMAVLGLCGAVGVGALAVFKRKVALLRPCSLREQTGIALCAVGINYANVFALKHLPLTMFYVVIFTIPLVIAALSALLKHERLTLVKIGCLIAGFFGAALAIGVAGSGGDALGYAAAFTSVLCFSIYTILMRKIAKTDTVESTQFINALCVGAFGLAGALAQASVGLEGKLLALMIVAGIINVFGNILYNTALQNTVSTNVAQLHYTQIISGAILGYLIWHEVPTWNLITGSLVIIASGMIVAAQAHRRGAE